MFDREPPHYLKELKTTTVPQRLAWLDCAGVARKERGVFVERWQYGTLGLTWRTSKRNEQRNAWKGFTNSLELWKAVDGFCRPNRRVVLFAYDLAYQLRISQALVHLPALGWHVDKIVLERTAAWALLRDDKRTLMCCDLRSWTPVGLDTLAADMQLWRGHTDAPLAYGGGHEYECMRNANIVRDCVLDLLSWIDAENLGPFRPTGSGQSYSAFRRRFLSHKLLVHDDQERLELERAAMWTGRCEAWQHGTPTGGPFIEYDMHAAYCTIAAECQVPTVARRVLTRCTPARLEQLMETYAVMAEVELTTQVPCVPTRYGGRTVWPVGTFKTVLWDPELRLALQYADAVNVKRAWLYDRDYALRDFATWVLDGLEPQQTIYGPMPRRALKHWSRCLVGRLGLRYRAWEPFGSQPVPDLRLVSFIDADAGVTTDMLIAGHERMILADMSEAVDSLPQIPGWVMSECRARLWAAMFAVGHEHVCYVDTDSLIVNMGTSPAGRLELDYVLSGDWTRKGQYTSVTIHGPRNLVCETQRRVSGLPLKARQVAPLEFTGQVMRSIKESMRAGELDCVASVPRKFVLDAPDLRRQHLPDGKTAPFTINTLNKEPHQ